MESKHDLVWVTPDPDKVKRLVALKRNGRWTEIYRGERVLVHKSYLYYLQTKGLIECGEDFGRFVFDDPIKAENASDNFKVKANGY